MINSKAEEIARANNEKKKKKKKKRKFIDSSYQGVKRLVVPAYDNTPVGEEQVSTNSFKKYVLPRVNIEN